MVYEITTTTNGLLIIHGMDKHQINMSHIVDVVMMGYKVCLVTDFKDNALCIDFSQGVILNNVTQTTIYGFYSAISEMVKDLTFVDTFTNDDLISNVLTVVHKLNANITTTYIFDDLGNEVTGQYISTKVDNNTIRVDFGEAISNTWTIIIRKES